MGVEYGAVRLIGPRVIAFVIAGDPGLQICQHRILRFARGVFMRLPRPAHIIGEAGFAAGIQEYEFRALWRGSFHQFAITSLDNPVRIIGHEIGKRSGNRGGGTLDGNFARFPDNGIEVEMGDAGVPRKGARECAFTRTGVAEDKEFQGSAWSVM